MSSSVCPYTIAFCRITAQVSGQGLALLHRASESGVLMIVGGWVVFFTAAIGWYLYRRNQRPG